MRRRNSGWLNSSVVWLMRITMSAASSFLPSLNCQQQFQQVRLHGGRGVADHAQIQQRDVPAVGEKDIPRMRIGMKQSVHQHCFKYALNSSSARGAPFISSRARGPTRSYLPPCT